MEQPEELPRAPQDPGAGPLVVERARSPRADHLAVPTGGDDAVAPEQRDADERVEGQQHEHVEQAGAVSERLGSGSSPTTYPMNRQPTTTKCAWRARGTTPLRSDSS